MVIWLGENGLCQTEADGYIEGDGYLGATVISECTNVNRDISVCLVIRSRHSISLKCRVHTVVLGRSPKEFPSCDQSRYSICFSSLSFFTFRYVAAVQSAITWELTDTAAGSTCLYTTQHHTSRFGVMPLFYLIYATEPFSKKTSHQRNDTKYNHTACAPQRRMEKSRSIRLRRA